MLKLLLLLELRDHEQELTLLLLLLLKVVQQHVLADRGRRGTVGGLLALQALLLLAPRLNSTRILAVGAGTVAPLAIALLVRW